MDNTKFTENLELPVRNYSVTPNNNKKETRDDLYDEEANKDSESQSDKIEEEK